MKRLKVLIVEDDNDLIQLMVYLFKDAFDITAVQNPHAVWAELQHKQFDLLLIDHYLPGCNGLELYEQIQKHIMPIPPAVLMSSMQPSGTLPKRMGFIAKPFIDCKAVITELRNWASN